MAAVYGQSKIVFNASINGDVNLRVFERVASRGRIWANCMQMYLVRSVSLGVSVRCANGMR